MGIVITFPARLRAAAKRTRRARLASIRDARRKREIREDFAELQRVAGWGR